MLGLFLLAGHALSASDAAQFFQLVFLQAILIAFISATGFFRVQRLQAENDILDYIIAGFCLLPVSALFLLVFLGVFPVYREIWPVLVPIWVGGAASAVAASWSAVVQKRAGPFRAFGPTCLSVGIVAPSLVLLSDGSAHVAVPYLLLGAFQVINLALLFAFCPDLLRAVLGRAMTAGASGAWRFVREGAGVGAINVVSLLATFAVREAWRMETSAEFAALVFLLLRITDTVLQLGHMTLAGSSVPTRLFSSPKAGTTLFLTGIACFAMVAAIPAAVGPKEIALGAVILLLLACDAIRGLWSISILYQMASFRLRSYAIYMLSALVGGIAVFGIVLPSYPEAALAAYLATQIMVAAALTIRRAQRQSVASIA